MAAVRHREPVAGRYTLSVATTIILKIMGRVHVDHCRPAGVAGDRAFARHWRKSGRRSRASASGAGRSTAALPATPQNQTLIFQRAPGCRGCGTFSCWWDRTD